MNSSESYSNLNKDDIASATCPGPLWTMGDYPYPLVPQSAHPDLASDPGDPSTAGSYVPNFNAANDVAFSLAPTTQMGAFPKLSTQVDFTNLNVLDPWLMSTPCMSPNLNSAIAFYDVSAIAQPQPIEDPYWTAAATPDSGLSPTSTTLTSQDKLVWPSDFLQTPYTTPASSPGHGGEAGWPAPEHGAKPFEATTSPAGRDSQFSWPIPAASGHVASATYAPTTALGKRHHEAEEPQGDGGLVGINTHNMSPQKRARGRTSGILKAKRSTARTSHNRVARIPVTRNRNAPRTGHNRVARTPVTRNRNAPEAGRGAERPATRNAHGIHPQSLPGPSFQQGWMMVPAHGKTSLVEGSVDEEAADHSDSMVQQQQEKATEFFKIPRIFEPRYRMFLQASQDDLARGAVQTVKCRLCPGSNIKTFDEFKRHCRTAETHPLEILFCDRCGDFFARCDSLKRHNSQPPAECRNVTQEMAAEKHRVTKEEHERFIRQLKHSLTTGGVIGRSFSEIIKEKFPGSSKKRK